MVGKKNKFSTKKKLRSVQNAITNYGANNISYQKNGTRKWSGAKQLKKKLVAANRLECTCHQHFSNIASS